jgi:hypothetical protein
VHVVSAANASANTRFSVTVKGGLQLSIRAPMFAMRPDSTLLLATPADLIVNKGTGSAIIVSADSNVALVATQLDTLAAPPGAVRGHVILLARPDTTRRVTITAGADSLAPKEKSP